MTQVAPPKPVPRSASAEKTVAIIGNPNVGKSEVFNALTGLNQTTGNYPGVTVERSYGTMQADGQKIHVVDLPGSYSLAARSPDEVIAVDVLQCQQKGERPVDAVVVVVDASNLERNLFLVSQVKEFGLPLVIALNMMDIAVRRGLRINLDKLSERLGAPVVPLRAHKRQGVAELKQAVVAVLRSEYAPSTFGRIQWPAEIEQQVDALTDYLGEREQHIGRRVPRPEAFRILVNPGGYCERRLEGLLGADFKEALEGFRHEARTNGSLNALEARTRYQWAREVLADAVEQPAVRIPSNSETIDAVLTHWFTGSVLFLAMMAFVFQAIYAWSAPFMDLIEGTVASLGGFVGSRMPEGVLQSLIVDGVIAGVGGVLVFLPQILVLSFFIAILEDCGYMARAAFLMDRLFKWCGLSGQSFIPMLSSFACAIPGIMATRTIENTRDRLMTMMVAPLMSCSARLPVYLIMIAAFVPEHTVFEPELYVGGVNLLGFLKLGLQGLTLLLMYLLGVAVAIPVAWVMRRLFFRGEAAPFLIELPTYKMPLLRTVGLKVFSHGKEFVIRAGTVILAITIIIWALAYFPRSPEIEAQFEAQRVAAAAVALDEESRAAVLASINEAESGALLRNSFLGRMGLTIEPVVEPLGWDWRIGTAAIASFPAREVIIATLGTLFNLGTDEDEASEPLRQELRNATWPDGRSLFNLPVAISIMVFFALCCQCGATLAMMKRETGMWRWPIYTFLYMTVLAYIGAFAAYHIALSLGWGSI